MQKAGGVLPYCSLHHELTVCVNSISVHSASRDTGALSIKKDAAVIADEPIRRKEQYSKTSLLLETLGKVTEWLYTCLG